MLHFSLVFPICSSRFLLRFWMLWLLLIFASFDNVLLFSLCITGTLRGLFLLFSIVNEIYEYYKAPNAISLFQMNEFFHTIFGGFKLEIFNPRNSRNPIRFPTLSKEYSNDWQYDPVLFPNKLIYRRRINSLKKRLILT